MAYIMENDIGKVLLSEEQIADIVKRIGEQISEDYSDSEHLVLLCVLKGSAPFFGDLVKHISVPCEFEFMRVSSYGSGSVSSGELKIILDMNRDDIAECDVVIVEDIIDSGNTLFKLKKYIQDKGAKSVKICTLLDKPDRRAEHIKDILETDYTGAIIPDEFVVGYGLDYNEKYRNLPYVGILKREVYEK
jgi:hypoxanthine phosphoribosyltransferase